MCGIVGEIGPDACDQEQLLRMMGMLTHRGPDEAGFLLADGVSWGHLRLSIVDLDSGQQPMSSHDGRYWIVLNGEIFNYIELRSELESLGRRFITRSDTEVLLEAYREWGTACLDRFNGQWAFALWDMQAGIFLLARDRWGARPLFYAVLRDGKTIVFASEMKAILADSRIKRDWDLTALRDVLTCWVCEDDRSPIASIRQVLPGAYLEVKDGKSTIKKWWGLDYSPECIDWERSEESWCEELKHRLAMACKIRLRADVPVGSYLSGGLDSSIIAMLARIYHQNDFQTFSLSFSDPGFDESEYQRLMASHLGTSHHEVQIRRDAIANSFQQAIWHTETPIYRTAPVPMMHLAKLVRECGFKVVLTGEGADEVFGGYDQFKEDKIRRFWARQPNSAWRKRLLDRLERNIPGTGPRNRAFWYAFFGKDLQNTGLPGYSHRIRWLNGLSLLPLLDDSLAARRDPADSPESNADPLAVSGAWISRLESSVPPGFDRWPALSKAQYWECRQLLAGYLLSSQGDRMAMAHSVEGRYPFLDVNVYELARRMPPDLKLRSLTEKYILKKAFNEELPPGILARVKNPYRAPDAMCFTNGCQSEPLFDSFSPGAVRRRGLFSPEAIGKLLTRVTAQPEVSARDNMALVLAYSAHIFHDLFIEGRMTSKKLPFLQTRVNLLPSVAQHACPVSGLSGRGSQNS